MTKISDKNIAVFFATRGFMDADSGTSKFMGRISYEDMIKIMVDVENYVPYPDDCMYRPSIRYTADIDSSTDVFDHPKVDPYIRHNFKLIDTFWGGSREFPKCPQAQTFVPTETTNVSRMFLCATCLKTGKCKDNFMRDTFGRILFPGVYTKEQQK